MKTGIKTQDRYAGCLVGLAVCDALGTTLEFKRPGGFEPIDDMVGGGAFDLEPGQWTDDTSMALCLADSLIERRTFDPRDQMERYWRWYQDGYLSSTGECFDIGLATSTALKKYHSDKQPYAGSTDPRQAGNGSLMRLAPVPMRYEKCLAKGSRCAPIVLAPHTALRRLWMPVAISAGC